MNLTLQTQLADVQVGLSRLQIARDLLKREPGVPPETLEKFSKLVSALEEQYEIFKVACEENGVMAESPWTRTL